MMSGKALLVYLKYQRKISLEKGEKYANVEDLQGGNRYKKKTEIFTKIFKIP